MPDESHTLTPGAVKILIQEAEAHRAEYDRRSESLGPNQAGDYLAGRRDEAGHWRDRLLQFQLAAGIDTALAAVEAFVARVDARAEAEIGKTHIIAGAHYRAMRTELEQMRADLLGRMPESSPKQE